LVQRRYVTPPRPACPACGYSPSQTGPDLIGTPQRSPETWRQTKRYASYFVRHRGGFNPRAEANLGLSPLTAVFGQNNPVNVSSVTGLLRQEYPLCNREKSYGSEPWLSKVVAQFGLESASREPRRPENDELVLSFNNGVVYTLHIYGTSVNLANWRT